MKRVSLFAMAAIFAVLLAGLPAAAQTFVGAFDAATNDPTELAALYSNLPHQAGPSNRLVRTTEFTTEVQVAQWSRWEFLGTKWTWFVRKPGEYYADSIQAQIQSNGNVAITFDGFSNPKYLEENELDGVKQEIVTYYGVGSHPTAGDFTGWIAAEDLNGEEVLITDSKALHEGLNFKLWNKITVCECNSAGIYRATGVITMTLQNQMPWLDEEGDWNPGQFDLGGYVTADRG